MSVAENVGNVRMDLNQFQQAITNLTVNARDAMPHGGRLSIEAVNFVYPGTCASPAIRADLKPGRYALIFVTDNGTGIPEAVKSRIFEPFFTTKPLGKGTGLGLAMAYGFVTQSGGAIELMNDAASPHPSQTNQVGMEKGTGSTFRMYLPCETTAEAQGIMMAAAADTATDFARGNETILLVEDDEHVCCLCRCILESCGYTVLEAADGVEALAIFKTQGASIDLLLTDVVMPRLNGPKLHEAIRVDAPDLPVLFISGYADGVLVHASLMEQFNLLRKPFSPSQLANRVRDTLNAQSRPHS